MTFRHIFDGAGPRRSSLSPGAPPSGLQLVPRQRPRQGFSAKESLGAVARRSRRDGAAPVPSPPVPACGHVHLSVPQAAAAPAPGLSSAPLADTRSGPPDAQLTSSCVTLTSWSHEPGVAAGCEAGTPPLGFSADGLHAARGTHRLRERFHAVPHTPSAPSCASCRSRCSVSHAVSVNRRGVLLCSTTHQAPRAAIASPAQ